MGNRDTSTIVSKGTICVETSIGCKLALENVRHVPDIRLNLLSVGKLEDIGLGSYFGEGKWKLTKGSLILARGAKQGCHYVTKTKLCKTEVNIAERDSSIELWHKRLGYMSEKGLHSLARKDFLPELKGMTLRSYVDCLAGKQHRFAFCTSTVPHRAKNILDLVHIDVCDDHSQKVFAYVLKNKFQVLDAFKEFHAKVERETSRKLKCIRLDNGGEYRGPFERYCRLYGI
jgi:hypothetical protein